MAAGVGPTRARDGGSGRYIIQRPAVADLVVGLGMLAEFDFDVRAGARQAGGYFDVSLVLSVVLSLVRSRARQGDYGIRHAATFASLCAHGVNEDALLSHLSHLAALPTRDLIH
jgi:hypothetical protein